MLSKTTFKNEANSVTDPGIFKMVNRKRNENGKEWCNGNGDDVKVQPLLYISVRLD